MKKKDKSAKAVLANQDPLTPINLEDLGSDKDPCFGTQYDLTTKECKMCGDSELCAFKMAQNLNITRRELEEKNHYKDLDILEDTEAIKKYMRKLKRQGESRKSIIKSASEKYEVPTKDLRKLYKELK